MPRTATAPTSSTTPAAPDVDAPRERFFDLSLTQLLGGSLAAATAAALGSRLGLVGTITGAAVISTISAVAASVYTQSMRRTRARLPVRRRGFATDGVVAGPLAPTPTEAKADSEGSKPPHAGRRRMTRVLAGALALFVVAGIAVTAWELTTGRALSGGDGTTVTQVTRSAPKAVDPAGTTTPTDAGTSTEGDTGSGTTDGVTTPTDGSTTDPGSTGEAVPSAPADGSTAVPADPTPTAEPTDPAATTDPAPAVDPGATAGAG